METLYTEATSLHEALLGVVLEFWHGRDRLIITACILHIHTCTAISLDAWFSLSFHSQLLVEFCFVGLCCDCVVCSCKVSRDNVVKPHFKLRRRVLARVCFEGRSRTQCNPAHTRLSNWHLWTNIPVLTHTFPCQKCIEIQK